MPARPRRTFVLAPSLLVLLVLPGCLTQALWDRQRFRTVTQVPTTSEFGVDIDRNPETGEVRAIPRVENGAATGGHEGGDGAAGGAWTFAPREDAEVAAALLAGCGGFRVRSAVFEVWPRGEPGIDLACPATLRLEGAFAATAIGAVGDPEQVPGAIDPAMPGAEALPAPLGEILRFAAAADLAPLAGLPDPRQPWRIVGCALVDRMQQPVATAARAVELLGADFEAMPLDERLRRLAGLSVLADVDYGGVRTRVVMRADALWLRQRLRIGENGLLGHDSRWVGSQHRAETAVGARAAAVDGEVRLHTVELRHEKEDGGTLQRVLLTPITVIVDVVTLGTVGYLVAQGGICCNLTAPQ